MTITNKALWLGQGNRNTDFCSPASLAKKLATHFVLTTLMVLTVVSGVYATVAEPVETDQVCQNWLTLITSAKGQWAGSTNPVIAEVTEIREGDTLLARCYLISPTGYIVVPVLKELPPVKAYWENSWLDINDTGGITQLIKDVLLHRTRLFIQFYGSVNAKQPATGEVLLDREHGEQWKRFTVDSDQFTASLDKDGSAAVNGVGPLLTSSWHQSSPYYNLCPMGDGGRCVVGCVATATAQIMAYWQWPPFGTGSESYWWPGDNSCGGSSEGDILEADFSDTYDWANIPDDCDGGCTQAEKDALAELCYEVGVAFNMDYGRCGSGAYTSYAQTVFPTYFRYDSSIDREDRSQHTPENWFIIIKDEIDAGRPMQYRIHSHSIVCDGWQVSGEFNQYHMNYGWGGNQNAWFTIDQLYCPWSGCTPMVEYTIRRIIPEADSDGDSIYNSLDNCPLAYNPDQEDIDEDNVGDSCDNCLEIVNHDQSDIDEDGIGDACDPDIDGDTILNDDDNCPYIVNSSQEDNDVDSVGNACDNCIDAYNREQYDENGDGVGDACDGELHIESYELPPCYLGVPYYYEFWAVGGTEPYLWTKPGGDTPIGCLFTGGSQGIIQGTPTGEYTYYFTIAIVSSDDPIKTDTINYQLTVTDPPEPDWICGDADGNEVVEISDVVFLISYIFVPGAPAPDPLESGDVDCSDIVEISDGVYLINYIFNDGPVPCEACP